MTPPDSNIYRALGELALRTRREAADDEFPLRRKFKTSMAAEIEHILASHPAPSPSGLEELFARAEKAGYRIDLQGPSRHGSWLVFLYAVDDDKEVRGRSVALGHGFDVSPTEALAAALQAAEEAEKDA
jgi:hypothetical protein